MVQFSLPVMLELVDEGVLSIERMVELMCHNPARLFSVCERGFLRPDYKGDITIVRPHTLDSGWRTYSEQMQMESDDGPHIPVADMSYGFATDISSIAMADSTTSVEVKKKFFSDDKDTYI